MGHSVDFVDESSIYCFVPQCEYKNVVVYLHEPNQLHKINYLLNNQLSNSFLIQHGIDEYRLSHKGYGGSQKINPREETEELNALLCNVSLKEW
jgi:hypothetical protein